MYRNRTLLQNLSSYLFQLTRWSSSSGIVNPNEKGELAESTLLLQQGTEIQEIPLAVIRDSADCKVNEGE